MPHIRDVERVPDLIGASPRSCYRFTTSEPCSEKAVMPCG